MFQCVFSELTTISETSGQPVLRTESWGRTDTRPQDHFGSKVGITSANADPVGGMGEGGVDQYSLWK